MRDGVRLGYPFVEGIRSLLPLVDELIVGVGDGDDGTWEAVQAIGDPKVLAFRSPWDPTPLMGGEELSRQTNLALARCTGDWAVYLQADEVLHEDDLGRVRDALGRHARRRTEGLLFDYLHFHGGYHFVVRGWHHYAVAVRAVRLDIGVRSVGDAAGFWVVRGATRRGLIKARAGARIFHYGTCRPPALQRAKQASLMRLYGETPVDAASVSPDVVFGRPHTLVRWDGTHPAVMQPRIAGARWHYDPPLPGRGRRLQAWARDLRSASRRGVASRLTPLPMANLWWRAVNAFRSPAATPRTAVVVLGDLGRSPRMLYHAAALADTVGQVDLVGYVESTVDGTVATHTRVRIHPMPAPAVRPSGALFLVYGLGRTVAQTTGLLWRLLRLSQPRTILVQNPPAIPTLLVALVAARVRRARLVVDWHNFGDSMLALRLGPRHPVVRLAHHWERILGGRADAHLCVSEAMRSELAERWAVTDAHVLPDRPAERFAALDAAARAAVRTRHARELGIGDGSGAAALAVSPIGWTADEDVGLLIDAARRYDTAAAVDARLPDLVVVLTGRGPLRDGWLPRLAALPLRRVRLRALWLEPDEYPGFVAAADVGISLHRSTSGVDLPMKIADLLGAGVPVCALDYGPCLREMLVDGETGRFFSSASGLADVLGELLRDHPAPSGPLAELRLGVLRATRERWRDAWTAVARPLFTGDA